MFCELFQWGYSSIVYLNKHEVLNLIMELNADRFCEIFHCGNSSIAYLNYHTTVCP